MNYVTPVSIYGLMNKNCFMNTDSPSRSFWKTRAQSKLVKCVSSLDVAAFSSSHPEVKQISFMYLDSPSGLKGEFHMEQIESLIDESFLPGSISRRNHKELFETIQKYKKIVHVECGAEAVKNRLDDVLAMIEKWRYSKQGGMKYGWVEHAGIDKACLRKCLEDEQFNSQVDVFLFLEARTNDVVGYSMIEKEAYQNEVGLSEVPYLIRKCLTEGRRNLTEYVDWWTFAESMRRNSLDKLVVNWGCSTGGVHWYKTHKWPVWKIEKKWFASWKGDVGDGQFK